MINDINNPTKEEIKELAKKLKEFRSSNNLDIPTLTQFALLVNIPVSNLKEYVEWYEELKYEYQMLLTRYENEMIKGALGKGQINPYGANFILERQFGYTKNEKQEKTSIYENMSDEELLIHLEKAQGELSNEQK